MNKLPIGKRVQILGMLCEGSSMRSISQVADVSVNTVSKLLVDTGEACLAMHDELVRSVPAARVQCNEVWSFRYSKQKNVAAAGAAPAGAGDVWTWTALDADTKLVISYFVGRRSGESALILADDLRARVSSERVQFKTDGCNAYLRTIEEAFGTDAGHATVEKVYPTESRSAKGRCSPPGCIGTKKRVGEGDADQAHVSTSYVERPDPPIRIQNHQITLLTANFSKKLDNHIHALALYFAFYNFGRIHQTLRMTPAMAAGLTHQLWSLEEIVERIDARQPVPAKRGTHGKKANG